MSTDCLIQFKLFKFRETCLLLLFLIGATVAYSQSVSIKVDNAPLKSVLEIVKKQTGYVSFYEKKIMKMAKPVTINVSQMKLEGFLQLVFKDQPLSFRIINNTIILSIKKNEGVADRSLTIEKNINDDKSILVKGVVKDTLGGAISSASVFVGSSSKKGVICNERGEFVISVKPNETVTISSLGFYSISLVLDIVDNRVSFKVVNREELLSLDRELRSVQESVIPRASVIANLNNSSDRNVDMSVWLVRKVSVNEEVVVVSTGYQKLPKDRATGAFSTITSKQIEKRTVPDILNIMEGMAPGFVVTKSANGVEGAEDPTVLMRGVSTFGNQQPLVVVDGFPIEGRLNTINPQDIETITLLRDAAAASIWGVKASNGVIVVTTKKGKSANPTTVIRTSISGSPKPDLGYLNLMSSAEMIDYEKNRFYLNPNSLPRRNVGLFARDAYSPVYGILMDYESGLINAATRDSRLTELAGYNKMNDAEKEFLTNQVSTNNTVSISASPNDRFNYYTSINWVAANSMYKKGGYNKTIVALNTEYKISSRLTLSVNTNYSSSKTQVSPLQRLGLAGLYRMNNVFKGLPYERFRDVDGNPVSNAMVFNQELNKRLLAAGFMDASYYPIDELKNYDITDYENNLRLQSNLVYKLVKGVSMTFGFKSETITGKSATLMNQQSFTTRMLINDFANTSGGLPKFGIPLGDVLTESRMLTNNYNARFQLDINQNIGKKSRIDATVGYEMLKSVYNNIRSTLFGFNSASNVNFPVDYASLSTVGNTNPVTRLLNVMNPTKYFGKSTLDDRYIFYYGTGSYTISEKYIFSASARINKSSRFDLSSGLNKQILSSAGVKWVLTKEKFLGKASNINLLAVRYTAGLTGNVPDLSSSSIKTVGFLSSNLLTGVVSLDVNSPANKKLQWEPTLTHNLGIDFAFFDNKINGYLDFYSKKTTGLLGYEIFDPTLTGFYNMNVNSADIKNHGIEIRLNTSNYRTKTIQWVTSLNLSYNKNMVSYSTASKNSVFPGAPRNVSGYPASTFFAYKWAGLNDKGDAMLWQTQPGKDPVKLQANKSGTLNFDDFEVVGSSIPVYSLGITNTVKYKNWDFYVLFVANGGNYMKRDVIMSDYFTRGFGQGFSNMSRIMANRWRVPGDENKTDVPRIGTFYSNEFNGSNINYISATYVRLRELGISYSISTPSMLRTKHISNILLQLQGRNLWLLTSNKYGIDPEAFLRTTGERTMPVVPSFTFGAVITFN